MGASHRSLVLGSLLPVVAVLVCGCGGGKGVAPQPAGATVRGTVSLPPGQSAQDVVVQVGGTALQARPAADGSFVILGVPPGHYTLSAVSPTTNFGAHVPLTVPAGGEVRTTDLELRPGGQIAGIVTALSEEGVQQVRAGAIITARPVTEYPVLPDGSTVRPGPNAGLAEVDPGVTLTATTGADGTYAIKGVPAGAYWLSASLEGFPAQELMVQVSVAATTPGDFFFGTPIDPATGTVAGRVLGRTRSGGTVPVAGAQVWADLPYAWMANGGGSGQTVPSGPGGITPPTYPRPGGMPPYWGYTVTAEDGTYTLNLPRGRVTIHCRHRDYQPASAEVTLGASATVDFTLEPGPAVPPSLQLTASVGKATYEWGEPVALSMVLRNTGTVPVTLSFTGQEATFSIYRGDELVWSYGSWPWYPVVMGERRRRDVLDAVLQPGGTREYRVSWNQRGFDGVVVEPGTFTLRGSVHTMDLDIESNAVTFQVVRTP